MSPIVGRSLFAFAAGSALVAGAATALAGGFAVREQSAQFQGSSFAGDGAGGALSSMFWNPAALGLMGKGLETESVYSLVAPHVDFTALPGTVPPLAVPGTVTSTNTGHMRLIPASYGAYRLSPDFAVGISLNAPLGLGSEPDADAWAGRMVGRTAKLTTYNATPTLAYRLAPWIFIGAGVQFEYAKLVFKFGDALAVGNPNGPSAGLSVEDKVGIGYTAGILLQPAPGTSIGLGFRSSIQHDFEGVAFDNGLPTNHADVKVQFDSPETVTLSLRQALAPRLTGLATIEWSNWSRFDSLPIVCRANGTAVPGTFPLCVAGGNFAVLNAHWHDGWFYALGLEYAYMPGLTLRTGVAYEKSPIQNATERLPQVPDSDRVWLSGGLSYALFPNVTLDLAYTHIFVEDAHIDRTSLTSPALRLVADREASVDIFTLGVKMALP